MRPFFIDPLSAPVREFFLAVLLLAVVAGAVAWEWQDARQDALDLAAAIDRTEQRLDRILAERCPPPVARGYRVISWLDGDTVRCQVVLPIGAVVSAK